MQTVITTLLQPFVYLLVLLVELYKAIVPSEGVSMKDTIKSARESVQEVRDAMGEFKDEFAEEDEPKKTKSK